MANVRKQEKEQGKTVRVPFSGNRYKLQLSDADNKEFTRKGWVTHWFNDQDGRVERALGGGYQFVTPEEAPSLGRSAIHQGNTDEGSKVSKIVSRGEPVTRAYLMKIKETLYNADQKAKQAINDQVDEALAAGQAGGATIENQYTPGTRGGKGPGVTYSR